MRGLAILALCLLPLAAQAQDTPSARDEDFLTAFLEDSLSDAGRQVVIDGFSGALSSTATMRQMTIADGKGIWLTVRDVKLDWSRSRLLSGQVQIQEFSAGEILLDRLPEINATGPEARSFRIPDLPVSIDIGKIEARRIVLGTAVFGQPVEGSLQAELQLAGGEGAARLELMRHDAGSAGRFRLEATYDRNSEVLDIALEAVEGAGGIAVSNLGVPGLPSAELTVRGRGLAENFVADLRLATDGVTRLAGKVATEATEAGPGFVADLSGDMTPVFLPQYADFFGPDVSLHARGRRQAGGGFDLQEFRLTGAAIALDGRLSLDAAGLPQVIDLTGQIAADGDRVLLPLSTPRETWVKAARLQLAYDRAESDSWQGEVVVTGLDHAVMTAESLVLGGAGRLAVDGGLGRFEGAFDFSAEGLAMADAGLARALGTTLTGAAQVRWETGSALELADLRLTGAGFDLRTTGRLGDLAGGLTLTGGVKGEIADLSRWSGLAAEGLAGAATLDLKGSATLLTGAADLEGTLRAQGLSLGIPALDAALAGESLLDLSLKRDETGVQLRRLNLDMPGLAADLAGWLTTDALSLNGQFAASDLETLAAGLGGALMGDIALSGPMSAPEVAISAQGRDLSLGQAQLDRLLAGDTELRMEVLPGAHGITIRRVELGFATGGLTAAGRLDDLVGSIRLDDLGILTTGLRGRLSGDWHLAGPMGTGRLQVRADTADLATGAQLVDRLLAGSGRLEAALTQVQGGARLDSLSLDLAQMGLTATGMIGAERQEFDLTHRIRDLEVLVQGLPGALTTEGKVTRGAQGFDLDLTARGPGQIVAMLDGRAAADLSRADLDITGTASAAVTNGFAAPRTLGGSLRYDLRLSGPWALSSLSGVVDLSGGRLADPNQTFGLRDMAARFTLGGGRAQLAGNARVTSGGTITASGQIGLNPPHAADLALSLSSVRLRDPDLYSTQMQGALTLKGPITGDAVIAGTLNLGQTELRIPSSDFAADGGLPGLRHLTEPAASRETRVRAGLGTGGSSVSGGGRGFGLDLRINAPNQVFIRGRGLDAELGGRLVLRGQTDAVVPSGAFNLIRGRLEILGRRLELSEALLQLQGRIVPYVRVVASVESEGVRSQVQIEGPADDPEVKFLSFPDLPEEEMLARLLFDRGLETLTAFQAIQLASAVATLAGRGGEGVIANLRRKAGVDNLDIQTSAEGETTVSVGKYLSDKAYTEVQLGQNGKTEISINLDLAPHITLKGQLDSEGKTGIGLFLQRDY